jgi:hypothetical protein
MVDPWISQKKKTLCKVTLCDNRICSFYIYIYLYVKYYIFIYIYTLYNIIYIICILYIKYIYIIKILLLIWSHCPCYPGYLYVKSDTRRHIFVYGPQIEKNNKLGSTSVRAPDRFFLQVSFTRTYSISMFICWYLLYFHFCQCDIPKIDYLIIQYLFRT